jgi:spermidine/putrescine transport system ATP-binding protein
VAVAVISNCLIFDKNRENFQKKYPPQYLKGFMAIIQLKNIEKYFGANCVIPTLNLDIETGEFLTLLGPSGCGKTTLLRMIAGFETPTRGQVFLESTDITPLPPYHRPVNTVFQNYALFPHLTVAENVAFGLVQKGVDKATIKTEVKNVLDMVQMGSFASRKPKELSGGQQQRIALARAIVNKPKVLLLDEPLAALDLKLRKQMQLELKNLHQQLGITFIFVTHDQEEALTMSDRIAVMNKGVIEQIDRPQTVYDHPRTQFVADFIGENNTISGEFDGKTLRHADLAIPVQATTAQTGKAYLFIRPEHVVIHRQAPPQYFGLSASILGKTFLGNQWKIHCQLDTGEAIDVAVKPDEVAKLDGLEKVFLNWDLAKATLAFE